MDDCQFAVAVNFGTQVGSFSCAAAKRVDSKVESDSYRFVKVQQCAGHANLYLISKQE